MHKVIRRDRLFLIIVILIGFTFRLFFLFHSIDYLVFDSMTYAKIAQFIKQHFFFVDCCDKNSGYPLFLLLEQNIFGDNSLVFIKVIQIVIDLFTAILLYLSAKPVFGKNIARYSLLIYALNPFIAAYANVILPETLSIFVVAVSLYFISRPAFLENKFLWFSWGFSLGLLVFLRYSLFYLTIVAIVSFSLLLFRNRNRIIFGLIVFAGFCMASWYTLIGNYSRFHVVSFIPPYNTGSINLYLNYYNDKPFPELLSEFPLDPRYLQVMNEFYYNYDSPWMPQQVAVLREKYSNLFWKRFVTDWPIFFSNVFHNMILIWDKRALFSYIDPFYPNDTLPLRFINTSLLFLSFLGLFFFINRQRLKSLWNPEVLFSVLFFFYITFFFTLVSNETRHSIIYYGILSFWAGAGIYIIRERWKDFSRHLTAKSRRRIIRTCVSRK